MRMFSDSKLQEVYERGFQNGFSVAINEKSIYNRATDDFSASLGIIEQRTNFLLAHLAIFTFHLNDSEVYKFFRKVHKTYYTENGIDFETVMNKIKKRIPKFLKISDFDKSYRKSYCQSIIDAQLITDWLSDEVDVKELNKLLREAKQIANKLKISKNEINDFYLALK